MKRGLLYDHDAFDRHDTGFHVENATRLVEARRALARLDCAGVETVAAAPASRSLLRRVHPDEHLDAVEAQCARSEAFDADTPVVPASWRAALLASGAAADAAVRTLKGDADAAFVLSRPPGHHATPTRAMGFCLLNHAAVAAEAALAAGARRVAIVDPDVHHGNGTQDAFYARRDVFYASLHEWPLYPGTGAAGERGAGAGLGYTLNMPVPAATGERGFDGLVEGLLLPALRAFAPDLLVVSAGYDAHAADPLGHLLLSSLYYHDLFSKLAAIAPVVAVLEGGYDPVALGRSVAGSVAALAGASPPAWPEARQPGRDLGSLVEDLRKLHADAGPLA
ncbi:MAG TPA: histone deacetylase [Candidatus Thermoplasmatota archaeon]|nr:histone deacetylase [Candidatus Thermoplasmatota archaeon]